MVNHWSNTGQTLVKYGSNTGRTLVEHWSNTGQTLVELEQPPIRAMGVAGFNALHLLYTCFTPALHLLYTSGPWGWPDSMSVKCRSISNTVEWSNGQTQSNGPTRSNGQTAIPHSVNTQPAILNSDDRFGTTSAIMPILRCGGHVLLASTGLYCTVQGKVKNDTACLFYAGMAFTPDLHLMYT
jgi:hypothetical protein